ncbi:MAG: SDR family oxidoreductase [Rhodospirillales bacterium]|nr:SDR family oxidoreductase [Rhodospirillales bacterium]
MSIIGVELFEGERALVTGAASNIGRAIATHLAAEGALLTVTDVDAARLSAVVDEISTIGKTPRSIVSDLSDTTGWRAVWEFVADAPPSIFVHSACPQRHEKDLALSVSEDTFDAMINTNLRSGFLLGRQAASAMRQAKVAGRLLYLTSLHATEPRNLAHYSASKAGMTMIMKELARELGPDGIRVNGIAPGAIPGGGFATSDDAFQPKRKIPMGRFGHADDIARAAMALLSNDFMGYVTGTTLIVDGGLQLFNWIDFPDNP